METKCSASAEKLRDTIQTIDSISQQGMTKISTIAQMALGLMETERAYLCPEILAQVLTAIAREAEDVENLINSEAESVDCNYKDMATERRYEARRAAELRMKGAGHA